MGDMILEDGEPPTGRRGVGLNNGNSSLVFPRSGGGDVLVMHRQGDVASGAVGAVAAAAAAIAPGGARGAGDSSDGGGIDSGVEVDFGTTLVSDEILSENIPGLGTFYVRKDKNSRKRRRDFVNLGRSQRAAIVRTAYTVVEKVCDVFCPGERMELLDALADIHPTYRRRYGKKLAATGKGSTLRGSGNSTTLSASSASTTSSSDALAMYQQQHHMGGGGSSVSSLDPGCAALLELAGARQQQRQQQQQQQQQLRLHRPYGKMMEASHPLDVDRRGVGDDLSLHDGRILSMMMQSGARQEALAGALPSDVSFDLRRLGHLRDPSMASFSAHPGLAPNRAGMSAYVPSLSPGMAPMRFPARGGEISSSALGRQAFPLEEQLGLGTSTIISANDGGISNVNLSNSRKRPMEFPMEAAILHRMRFNEEYR